MKVCQSLVVVRVRRYALSPIGEPRSTVDVDIAIKLDEETGAALLERASSEFCVPIESARVAIQARSSFNLIDTAHGLKVDLVHAHA